MANRSYDQYCPIAGALDVLGERWTLLILRELLLGPRRFTDLRRALPGLAPNLLAERLRALEDQGLVAQEELPPPAARSVYVATAEARAVVPVLRALARFGMPRLAEPVEGSVRPSMAVWGALASQFDPVAAGDLDVAIRLELDGEPFDLAVRSGRLRVGDDGRPADVTLSGSPAALVEVCQGRLTLAQAARQGRLTVTGEAAARRRVLSAFHLASR